MAALTRAIVIVAGVCAEFALARIDVAATTAEANDEEDDDDATADRRCSTKSKTDSSCRAALRGESNSTHVTPRQRDRSVPHRVNSVPCRSRTSKENPTSVHFLKKGRW